MKKLLLTLSITTIAAMQTAHAMENTSGFNDFHKAALNCHELTSKDLYRIKHNEKRHQLINERDTIQRLPIDLIKNVSAPQSCVALNAYFKQFRSENEETSWVKMYLSSTYTADHIKAMRYLGHAQDKANKQREKGDNLLHQIETREQATSNPDPVSRVVCALK